MSTRTRSAIERYVAAYRSGDTTSIPAIIASDYVDHTNPAFGGGPEGVIRAIESVHAALSDVTCSLEHCLCDGDAAAFRVVVSATHTGVFAGRPPTGRRFRWSAADFVELRDGQFIALWSVQDSFPLLEATGGARRMRAPGHGDPSAFPAFMRRPENRIAAASQLTADIEGYLFDGADGSQAAFWTAAADRTSAPHTHDFDEYVLVVDGRVTAIVGGRETDLRPGDELVIPRGTPQQMAVAAGTRTVHVFGGPRARRHS